MSAGRKKSRCKKRMGPIARLKAELRGEQFKLGYRLLRKGELIKGSDEFYTKNNTWVRCQHFICESIDKWHNGWNPVRRKI